MIIIAFLRFFLFILQKEEAADDLVSVPGALRILFLNFHPVQVEQLCLTLEVFGGNDGIMWMEDVAHESILDAFGAYKQEHNFKYRFEPFIMTLVCSDNLIVILSILGFLRNFLAALDQSKRNLTMVELDQSN